MCPPLCFTMPYRRQSQPGAFANAFRCEERLERALQRLGVHAAPGVAHRQLRRLAGRQPALFGPRARQRPCLRLDLHDPGAVERVARVRCKVQQHLLEL